jgi:hypothetical protein
MKKIIEFLKENWANLLIGTIIIGFAIFLGVLCVHDMTSEAEPTVEFTQEEFELELIDVDLQKHYKPEYFQRLNYEIIEVTKENETYKVYLLTYLVSNDRNEIWTYAARVKKTSDGWDVDTERVYYK